MKIFKLVFLIAFATICLVAPYKAYINYIPVYEIKIVDVKSGESINQVLAKFSSNTFINRLFTRALINFNNINNIQSGEYDIGNLSIKEIIFKMRDGKTITHKIKNLPDELLLLPGHDYLKNNITFLQSLYKDSSEIGSQLDGLLSSYDSNQLSPLFDIGFEKKNNPFLRIDEFSFLDFLEKKDLFKDEKMEFRFKLLRQLRDEH